MKSMSPPPLVDGRVNAASLKDPQTRGIVLQYDDFPEAPGFALERLTASTGNSRNCPDINTSVYFIRPPEQLKTFDCTIGVTLGPWKTIMEHRGDNLLVTNDITGLLMLVPEEDGRIKATAHCSYDNSADFRIVGFNKNGLEFKASSMHRNTSGNDSLLTAEFTPAVSKELKTFKLQIRPYEWVTFKNVALQPLINQKGSEAGSAPDITEGGNLL